MDSVEKGNVGEQFVNELAYNSFMKYWCYPNPKDENGDKKEICDLMIFFRDCLIIISVKNYVFKDFYSRYFRNTIEKAVDQISGAERKLMFSEREIYIKHPNKDIERFPREEIRKVFRIIVNLGDGVKFYPSNKETQKGQFVTIFDKGAFETIVKELDTLPDFIDYLTKREELFSDKTVLILPGEEHDFSKETTEQFLEHTETNLIIPNKQSIVISGTEYDILAYYLEDRESFLEKVRSSNDNLIYLQIDDKWNSYISKEEVKIKKQNDRYSYFIDDLVKNEVLVHNNLQAAELAKELLSFNRFTRRIIAKNFLQFYETYKNDTCDDKEFPFYRRYSDFEGIGIVFVYYATRGEDVDWLFEFTLNSYCVYSNYKNKKNILIATNQFFQFKMLLQSDIIPFPYEFEQQIRDDIKLCNWFTTIDKFYMHETEYPENKKEKDS